MGTNYYLHEKACTVCGRGDPPLHIGKSSAGWVFHIHVLPELGINSLNDWQTRWNVPGVKIVDEYGSEISSTEMLGIITNRKLNTNPWDDESLRRNYAEAGPNNLARSRIDGVHCVGHGEGTYDYCAGEFS